MSKKPAPKAAKKRKTTPIEGMARPALVTLTTRNEPRRLYVAHVAAFAIVAQTGEPSTETSKSAGPTTRSSTIALVTRASSASEKPVQAVASARPCSNASHGELRNGAIATLTMTIAVAIPTRIVATGPRHDCSGSMALTPAW